MKIETAEQIKDLLLLTCGLVLYVTIGVLVMIKGWGLEPQSWWWILGVGIGGQILANSIIFMGKGNK